MYPDILFHSSCSMPSLFFPRYPATPLQLACSSAKTTSLQNISQNDKPLKNVSSLTRFSLCLSFFLNSSEPLSHPPLSLFFSPMSFLSQTLPSRCLTKLSNLLQKYLPTHLPEKHHLLSLPGYSFSLLRSCITTSMPKEPPLPYVSSSHSSSKSNIDF